MVYDYLAQIVPVAYDTYKFVWGKEIKSRLENEGYIIPEYNVYLSYAGETIPVYKAYTDEFFIDKSGNTVDRIKDIQIFNLKNSDGNTSAYGWLAHSDYFGSIYEKSIRGLRIRKGNILIGDGQTLNICFKDARFNGWVIGEIFVNDTRLVPNARRDNFEKNSAYFLFIEQIRNIASSITKDIRSASVARNAELSKVVEQKQEIADKVNETFDYEKIDSKARESLRKRLIRTQDALNQFSSNEEIDLYNKEIAFDEIDMLMGKIQGVTAYKSLNAMQNLSKVEKKTLEQVFDTIVSVRPKEAEELINSILKVFAGKSSK